MHPAAKLQFERIVDEFVRWRAIREDERPPAPAWWWGPAFELRNIDLTLPAGWGARLGLADGATYAAYDFSSKIDSTESDVRDLHVQPSDDSAFPP